jgi:hypothetical protein
MAQGRKLTASLLGWAPAAEWELGDGGYVCLDVRRAQLAQAGRRLTAIEPIGMLRLEEAPTQARRSRPDQPPSEGFLRMVVRKEQVSGSMSKDDPLHEFLGTFAGLLG